MRPPLEDELAPPAERADEPVEERGDVGETVLVLRAAAEEELRGPADEGGGVEEERRDVLAPEGAGASAFAEDAAERRPDEERQALVRTARQLLDGGRQAPVTTRRSGERRPHRTAP